MQGLKTLWLACIAVLWSFLGVRKASGFEADRKNLNPYTVLGVGFAMGLLLVLVLWLLVQFAVKWAS